MKHIVILGAGITGLTCAYELLKKGHKVSLYEKETESGGLAATYSNDGFLYDFGPHEFCTNNKSLIKLLENLLGDKLLLCTKKSAQYFNGTMIDYPAPLTKLIAKMDKMFLFKVVLEVFYYRIKRMVWDYSEYSFEHWVESRFGSTLYRFYFEPYTKKVWGIPPNQLDSTTASNRIAFNSIFDFAIKTIQHYFFGKTDYSNIHSPLIDNFYYSKGGIGVLINALEEQCRDLGAEFHFDHSVSSILKDGSKIKKVVFENGNECNNFDYLVNTIPLNVFLSLMGNDIGYFMKFRSIIFVFIGFEKDYLTNFDWIYVPDKDVCFQRMTEFKHIDPSMAPSGKTGVCFEISCFESDKIWGMEDNLIVNKVMEDLKKIGLDNDGIRYSYTVKRTSHAYPIQFSGYKEFVSFILGALQKITNSVTVGRQGLYKHCNMNECMEMAISLADHIDNGLEKFPYTIESKWKGAGLEEERTLYKNSQINE